MIFQLVNLIFNFPITLAGIECGKAEVPGVYANVAKFRTWIDEQMEINSFDSKPYISV
jgi:secreted trypsin-like serine protease